MDNLTVIDGDYTVQISHLLNMSPTSEPLLDLHVLNINRYALYLIHLNYLRAGAKIIKTNTCRTNTKFMRKYLHISNPRAKFLTTAAVEMAKQAVLRYCEETGVFNSEKHRILIAGCCGSFGISRIDVNGPAEYWNFIPRRVIIAWHYSHIKALLAEGVDLLAFESIPCLTEAKAIITILTEFPGARAWITFLCSQEEKLPDGNIFAEAATYCYDSLPDQIIAIGVDCPSVNSIKPLLKSINDSRDSKIPFLFYADKHYLSSMENNGATNMELWHNFVQECLDIGIRYIGGGSNTNIEDIENICIQIESYRKTKSPETKSKRQS